MKRIGFVGENENDVKSIAALLRKRFSMDMEFFVLLFDVNGNSLDNTDFKNRFRREFEIQRDEEGGVDLVIIIRDLDSLEDDKKKVDQSKSYFKEWNKTINQKGIFLLNIYELEALIWADIEGYNIKYGTNIPPFPNPMMIWEPKEELRKHVSYSEGGSPRIFNEALRPDIIAQNCRYFAEFLREFENRIA